MVPLYLIIVFGLRTLGYDDMSDFMAFFLIFLGCVFDIDVRVNTHTLHDDKTNFSYKLTLIDRLTIPSAGYIFHFFIFPIPLWMVAFGATIIILSL